MKAPKVDKHLPHREYLREELRIVKELLRVTSFKQDKILRRLQEMEREEQQKKSSGYTVN
jgi:hypothetical protein